MTPTPLTHRPQTLKQAKKAYRKAGATVRLSESEKAVLERRAVLQERADRIKEREARRKANLKRKEERVQKEREARHRMGIPTPPAKEGIQVGPSQLHLSNFIYAGAKRKRDDGEDEEKIGLQNEEDLVLQEQHMSPMEPPPSRQPLQSVSANANSQRLIPPHGLKAHSPKVRDFALHEKPVLPKQTPMPSTTPPFQLTKRMREDEVPEPFRSVLLKAQRLPQIQKKLGLLLPPLCRPPASQQKPAEKTESRHTPTLQAAAPNQIKKPTCIPPPAKPHSIPEDSFDDFFVSNTQIQRELSPPPTPPAKTTPIPLSPSSAHPPTPPPLSNPPTAKDAETASLLAQISTQDLDFSEDLTQHSPSSSAAPRHPSPSPSEENDFPDPELEEIVLEYSLESPITNIKSSTTAAPPNPPPSNNPPPPQKSYGEEHHYSSDYDSENIDDASFLQAGLHQSFKDSSNPEKQCLEKERLTAAIVDCDDFELSTQDLEELET